MKISSSSRATLEVSASSVWKGTRRDFGRAVHRLAVQAGKRADFGFVYRPPIGLLAPSTIDSGEYRDAELATISLSPSEAFFYLTGLAARVLPRDLDIQLSMAVAKIGNGDYDFACRILRGIAYEYPLFQPERVQRNLAASWMALGNEACAIRSLERAFSSVGIPGASFEYYAGRRALRRDRASVHPRLKSISAIA